jgi:hypothetical protein
MKNSARASYWIGPDSLVSLIEERAWPRLVAGPYTDRVGPWGLIRNREGVRLVSLVGYDVVNFYDRTRTRF